MDILLAANISVAVIVLLSVVFVKTPLELSVFPSLLLATTLARLVLNLGTTRLILGKGAQDDMAAAGQVVQSFGQFVTGDQLIVGFVLFAIIIVIQFVVITKGATRISEVAARFALDGMPGKQMAIDAELAAGTIDAEKARHRRELLHRESDFYGAMDGASKFVRGDAIAGILITFVNIIGGFAMGISHGMGIEESAAVFTKLTIGDGLVSQIPAFLIALSAGFLVTRGNQKSNLPTDVVDQILLRPHVLLITAAFLGVLVFTQLPKLPLLLIGSVFVGLAVMQQNSNRTEARPQDTTELVPKEPPPIHSFIKVDPIEFELGLA